MATTWLASDAYDLVVTSLVDEHLADLRPLYAEAARVAKPDGCYVIVGYHPHFIMSSGMPTHLRQRGGRAGGHRDYVHLFSDHVRAAGAAGWTLVEARGARDRRRLDRAEAEVGAPARHSVAFAFAGRR